MMGLFFLVVCAVGILRPIKNALALDGLGDTDFYKVYLVSAVVILFVPFYNRLSDRLPWRWLIPAVSVFFALHLLVFRLLYVEGSTAFGLVFYGWYDLFAAALVTQFFMATQLFFDARLARQAYPVVIAGGSIGATLGGAVTGFFAERVGTPNLMLVAAALILVFSVGMPFVWRERVKPPEKRRRTADATPLHAGELRALLGNRQVRLIAAMVLITILVKQLVDYQFNTLSKEIFESRDAISAFQGKFNAATQWLPLIVLGGLQPLLRRWGVGLTVLLLPAAMLLLSGGLFLFWGLAMAVTAKAAETSLRYSAERAGREILYVPVPDAIKLRAKAYIDVAVEKGIGKVASAGLIFLLLTFLSVRGIALFSFVLAAAWVVMALGVKREYVRTLGRSLEGGFASVRGVFASLADATTLPVVRRALSGNEAHVAFTLDLVENGRTADVALLAPELHALLDHPAPRIRRRAADLLARAGIADPARVRPHLLDDDVAVREAAVRALQSAGNGTGVVEELLASEHSAVRTAVLACIARDEMGGDALAAARRVYADRWTTNGSTTPAAKLELALAAGALRMDDAAAQVETLLDDPDPVVASTALRSAGRIGSVAVYPRLIAALGRAPTREAARDALAGRGDGAVPALSAALLDTSALPAVRRSIPAVLARIPTQRSIAALVEGALAAETDQLLDRRAVRALSRLRAHHPGLTFDRALVDGLIARETQVARDLLAAEAALAGSASDSPAATLLRGTLRDAGAERRENVFRCLGLVYDADDMHRCHYAISRADARTRANAMEWLDQTVDRPVFLSLAPVLGEPDARASRGTGVAALLAPLAAGDDAWIASCARRVIAEQAAGQAGPANPDRSHSMDLVDKVFLLQGVDLLRDAPSAHLALLASIADEVQVDAGSSLVQRREPAGALFVVVEGRVRLDTPGGELFADAGNAFGTWALIDDAPSVMGATAAEPCRLLRIRRDDFHDLLTDHPELAIGMLQGLARRVRTLVA